MRKGTKAILVWVLLAGVLACANDTLLKEQAASRINIGAAYLGTGQYNAALKEFLEAEKLSPDDPHLYFLMGISYHVKGLDDLAVAAFQRSLALKPEQPEVYNYLGAIALARGRWDEAIVLFRKALEDILYETPANPLYNLGRAYYEKGEFDNALKYYQEAQAKDPYTVLMPLIEKNLGMTWLAKGDAAQALRHLQRSQTQAPSLIETQYWLGLTYWRLQRPDEARKAFESVVKRAPESEFGRRAAAELKTLP